MEFKALPQAIDSEREVLGAILKDNNNILKCEILKANDFYKEAHKIIFEIMQIMYRSNIGIDITTLANYLGDKLVAVGGITYISQIIGSTIGANTKDHVAIVRETANKRKIIKQCEKAMGEAYESKESKEIINSFQNGLLDIEDNSYEILTAEQVMERTIKNIEDNQLRGGAIIGMSTGIKPLDNATDGIIKKDVIVVAARPSMGKTLFALNLADNLSKNNNTALFEMEMNEESLGHRLLASKTRINGVKIRRGNLEDNEWGNVLEQSNRLASRNLFVDTSMNNTIYDIKNKCKKLKLQHGLDVIILDHIGLIKATDSKMPRHLQVAEITRECKAMAKELDIAVIILSQLSRAPEQRRDHRPILSDLRESGDIEQDADLIMFLYRDEYYDPENGIRNFMEVIVAKQRNGKVGTINLYCNLETQTIGDLELHRSERGY